MIWGTILKFLNIGYGTWVEFMVSSLAAKQGRLPVTGAVEGGGQNKVGREKSW